MQNIKTLSQLHEIAVTHPYYCAPNNYYSNESSETFNTWNDFMNEWGDADEDMNMVFRWDVSLKDDEKPSNGYQMNVFYMLQRKGNFYPVTINYISEADLPQILEMITKWGEYMKKVWAPVF